MFLGETPPRFGVFGVLTIVMGAYIVSIRPERMHLLDPVKRLASSAGAQLSIVVAFCYAVNTI
jgi:drug/metabolite transporter (DMT)-like permease